MQTLIDPFELSYATKAFPRNEQSGPRLIPPGEINARATLLDVDEIFWAADDDYEEDDDYEDCICRQEASRQKGRSEKDDRKNRKIIIAN